MLIFSSKNLFSAAILASSVPQSLHWNVSLIPTPCNSSSSPTMKCSIPRPRAVPSCQCLYLASVAQFDASPRMPARCLMRTAPEAAGPVQCRYIRLFLLLPLPPLLMRMCPPMRADVVRMVCRRK